MIQEALTAEEISACYPVMVELRPHYSASQFLETVLRMWKDGYHLAYLNADGRPVTTAGYRLGSNLAWGRFLYVDDLVTLSSLRGSGYGRTMLAWLIQQARLQRCQQFHLDSGLQRLEAHAFYEQQGLQMTSFHFKMNLEP
jgi:GNAT superfamily N-acetyltransferase